MIKRLLILLIIIASASAAAAQTDCGDGLPCGPIPWAMPSMPRLASPTPMPTIYASTNPQTPMPTGAPVGSAPAIDLDTADINNHFATLEAIVAATPVCAIDAETGECVDVTADLASNTSLIFGYTKGLSSANFGFLTPLIVFALGAFSVAIGVKITLFLLPALVVIFGFLRKLISLVLDFLPFCLAFVILVSSSAAPVGAQDILPTPSIPIDGSMPALPEFVPSTSLPSGEFASVDGDRIRDYIIYMAQAGVMYYKWMLLSVYASPQQEYLMGPEALLLAVFIFAIIRIKMRKWLKTQDAETQKKVKFAMEYTPRSQATARWGKRLWGAGFGQPSKSRWGGRRWGSGFNSTWSKRRSRL